MTIIRSRNVPNEQPPVHDIERLREWLSRMIIMMNGALDSLQTESPGVASVAIDGAWLDFDQVSGISVFNWKGNDPALPLPGELKADSSLLEFITELRVSDVSSNGVNMQFLNARVRDPHTIYIASYLNQDNFVGLEVTGPAQDFGVYHAIPVQAVTHSGEFNLGEQVKVTLNTFAYPESDSHYITELPPVSTSDSFPVTFLNDIVETQGDTYDVIFSFDYDILNINRSIVVGLYIDGVLIDDLFSKESKDATDNVYVTKFFSHDFGPGLHDIRVDFGKAGGAGSAVTLKNVRIKIEQRRP